MKWWQKVVDYFFCYLVAWYLILLSPLWLPVWLAIWIYKQGKEVRDEL